MGKVASGPFLLFVCVVAACPSASSHRPASHAPNSLLDDDTSLADDTSLDFSGQWTGPRLMTERSHAHRVTVIDAEVELAWRPGLTAPRPSAARLWAYESGVGTPWVLRPGRSSDDRFAWSTVVHVEERRILVGVSTWGTIHGKDVSVRPQERFFDRVPVLDLFTVPDDASNIQAVASRSGLVLTWSTSSGVYLHRVPLPPTSPETHHIRVMDVGMRQVALVNGSLFANVSLAPGTGWWASALRNATPDCVHPLSTSVATGGRSYVLPSTERTRLASPIPGGWEIEEYALQGAIMGALHAVVVPPDGWGLATSSSICRDRGVAFPHSRPRSVGRRRVAAPDGSRWVGATDSAAYLATNEAVLRVVWGEAEGPIRVEEVAVLPSGADATTIRVRAEQVAFGIPGENIAVVGANRLRADDGAFALAGDASVLVRREGYLREGARALVPTDALPLAAAVRANGTLVVALRTPRGALVVADITRDGELHMATMATFSHRFPGGAAFVGVDLLLIGSEP